MPEPLNDRVVEVPGIPGLKLVGPSDLPLEDFARWFANRRGRAMSIVHAAGLARDAPPSREVWTAPAVAERLTLSTDTVHRMCEAGELEGAFRRGPGGHWRIPVEGVERFIAATRHVRRRSR